MFFAFLHFSLSFFFPDFSSFFPSKAFSTTQVQLEPVVCHRKESQHSPWNDSARRLHSRHRPTAHRCFNRSIRTRTTRPHPTNVT